MSIRTRRVIKRYTSENRIGEFLADPADPNPAHGPEKRIFPGMFYLYLVAPSLSGQIEEIDVKFREPVQYPFGGSLTLEDSDRGMKFDFWQMRKGRRRELAHGKVVYTVKPRQDDNSNLEEFALKAGLPLDSPNLRALYMALAVPGHIFREFSKLWKGEGVYIRQELKVLEPLTGLESPDIRLRMDSGKRKRVTTDYKAGDLISVRGEAAFLAIQNP